MYASVNWVISVSGNGMSPKRLQTITPSEWGLVVNWILKKMKICKSNRFENFHPRNAFEDVICKILTISSQPQCVENHCSLVTPYGDTELDRCWLRKWLVAWRHQPITWTNVDLSSVRSRDYHLRAISQEIPQPPINEISLRITYIQWVLKSPRGQWVKKKDEMHGHTMIDPICEGDIIQCVDLSKVDRPPSLLIAESVCALVSTAPVISKATIHGPARGTPTSGVISGTLICRLSKCNVF